MTKFPKPFLHEVSLEDKLTREEIIEVAKTEICYLTAESIGVYDRLIEHTKKDKKFHDLQSFVEEYSNEAKEMLDLMNNHLENGGYLRKIVINSHNRTKKLRENIKYKTSKHVTDQMIETLAEHTKKLNRLSRNRNMCTGGVLKRSNDRNIGPGPSIPNYFVGPRRDDYGRKKR